MSKPQPTLAGPAKPSPAPIRTGPLPRRNRELASQTRRGTAAGSMVDEALGSAGQPLDPLTRSSMESRFGHDFSQVRVHADPTAARSADAMNASAYTVGRDIVFAGDQGTFQTPGSRRLLAHELTHTIQQGGGAVAGGIPQKYEVGRVDDPLEAEAERIADGIMKDAGPARRGTITPLARAGASSLLQRQPKPTAPAPTVMQGDVPGEKPEGYIVGFGADFQVRIDGDGDQYKELVLHLADKDFWPASDPGQVGPVKTMNLRITQISSGATRQADLSLPEVRFGGQSFPLVKEVTDGRGPTQLSLVINTTNQVLEIQPPERTPTGVNYLVSLLSQRISFQFPPETGEIHRVADVATDSQVTGNIAFAEETLGAYKDHFGITVRPVSPTTAQLGISAMFDGEPVNTDGAELQINGPIRFQLIDTGPVSFGIDLDGDHKPDLTIFDQLTSPAEIDGGGPPDKNRTHRLRVSGKPVGADRFFEYRVRDGYPVRGAFSPKGAAKFAESNALAVHGLQAQAKEGGFRGQLDTLETQLTKVRQQAADNGVIQKATFEAWRALSNAMIRLQPQETKEVDPALQNEAAASAKTFFDALAQETAGSARRSHSRVASTYYNPYTQETRVENLAGRLPSGAGPSLERDIRAGQWPKARANYDQLVAGFDRWIVDQLKVKRGEGGARDADRLATSKDNLSDIARYEPKRILAVFHPDEKFSTETGYVAELPLSLYYWREGDTWHLKDLTNPSKTYEYKVAARDNEPQPLSRLLGELNDPDHFPVGVIHFDVPGQYAGTVNIQDRLTWKKFFTYLSLGLAVAGVTLATAGTGTVAVVGGWALGASALLGAASAGIDLSEHIQQGNLDTGTAVLDLTQIVAGLSGVGSLASGGIVRSVATAAATDRWRWAGAWAKTAMFAGRVYLPITKVTAAADLITFAVVLPDTVRQLDDIQKGKGDQVDKDRAKLLLLTQLAVLGGLTALSAHGLIANPAKLPTLVLHPGPDGVPIVSTALTAESVVLDTNAVAAFEIRARGETDPKIFHEGHKGRIKAIEAMTDADLRVADPTFIEELGRKGKPVTQKGIGVTVDRASTEYKDFTKELESGSYPVGKNKGNSPIDRKIFADVAFAVKEPGVTPRFATADKGIYNALARRADNPLKPGQKIDPDNLGNKGVLGTFKNGFDVTINGRTVHVIPLP